MRVHLKGINTVKKHLADGTLRVHRYHRATGHPLPCEPGSPEFMAAYADAERTIADRLQGTFAGLISDYTTSPNFEKLAASSQAEYKRALGNAEREFGDMPLGALEDPRVRGVFMDYHDKVAKRSGEREPDTRLAVVSTMLGWAVQRSKLAANNIAGFQAAL